MSRIASDLASLRFSARWSSIVLHTSLYLWALGLLLLTHFVLVKINPALIGEEVSSAYRNPLYLEHRLQSDQYATNFSAYVFFWLGSHVLPLSLQSQRLFKILFLALISPILYQFVVTLRPTCRRETAILGAAVFPLFPSVAYFGAMATEYFVDAVFGLSYLLLVLRWDGAILDFGAAARRAWWKLFSLSLVFGWTVHFYPSSDAFLIVGFLVIGWKHIARWLRKDARVKCLVSLAFHLSGSVLAAAWPAVFFTGPIDAFTGGGTFRLDACSVRQNTLQLMEDLFVQTSSYLAWDNVFSAPLAYSDFGILVYPIVLMGAHAALRSSRLRVIVLVLVISLALNAISGPFPGIRRSSAALVALTVLTVVGVDELGNLRVAGSRVFRLATFFLTLCAIVAVANGITDVVKQAREELFITAILSSAVAGIGIAATGRDRVLRTIIGSAFSLALLGFGSFVYEMSEHYKPWVMFRVGEKTHLPYTEVVARVLEEYEQRTLRIDLADVDYNYILMAHLFCERKPQCFGRAEVFGEGTVPVDLRLNRLPILRID